MNTEKIQRLLRWADLEKRDHPSEYTDLLALIDEHEKLKTESATLRIAYKLDRATFAAENARLREALGDAKSALYLCRPLLVECSTIPGCFEEQQSKCDHALKFINETIALAREALKPKEDGDGA